MVLSIFSRPFEKHKNRLFVSTAPHWNAAILFLFFSLSLCLLFTCCFSLSPSLSGHSPALTSAAVAHCGFVTPRMPPHSLSFHLLLSCVLSVSLLTFASDPPHPGVSQLCLCICFWPYFWAMFNSPFPTVCSCMFLPSSMPFCLFLCVFLSSSCASCSLSSPRVG